MMADVEQLAQQIKAGNRRAIAKALTLVESEKSEDRVQSLQLLEKIYESSSACRRIAFSGVPGVGKSSLIEAYGSTLIQKGKKLAVLAIDPSSPLSGGSILGDKTRMETLSASDNAFVRPSPSRGTLGGVTRHTREACLIFEAAGFDYIFVETVGVGQSETVAHSLVDCFVMLHLPNSGDELQGIKKGITELADIVCIHKADKSNLQQARAAKSEQLRAQSFYHKNLPILLVSSLEKTGLEELEQAIEEFFAKSPKDQSDSKRMLQNQNWFEEELADSFLRWLKEEKGMNDIFSQTLDELSTKNQPASVAASTLIKKIQKALS